MCSRLFYFEFPLLFNLPDSVIPDLGSEPSLMNSMLLWVTFSRKLFINAQKRCYLSVAEVLAAVCPFCLPFVDIQALAFEGSCSENLSNKLHASVFTRLVQNMHRIQSLSICRACAPTAGRLCRQSSEACRQHVLGNFIPQAPEFKNTVWSGEGSSSRCFEITSDCIVFCFNCLLSLKQS